MNTPSVPDDPFEGHLPRIKGWKPVQPFPEPS